MPKPSEKTLPKPVAVKAPAKGDHVFLVDGSSYIFRAYHALPPLNRKSDGLQVNAVLGFCNMLWKLLREMPPDNRPTHLAIIFDKSEITFRNKLYPDYKAHRAPAPDDLIPQFPLIREAVRAFDLPCLEQVGFEADDLIATYVREACERGAIATIVSSDKDLMQLVTDCVTMYDTMKDRRIGIAEVIEKFGVPPEKVVEVQALAGDSTDNVPGVPGIGVKTAAQLIVEYGDLEELLKRAGEIKQPKRREALIENAEKARISRQLVLLDDKVTLDVPLDDLKAFLARAREAGQFAIEAKANSIDPMQAEICGIALALAPNDTCYIPLTHKQSGDGVGLFDAGLAPDQIKQSDALEALRPLLESHGILKIGFNIKFNAVMFAQAGIAIRNYDDAQLMSYALDAGRNAHGLDALAERWLGHATLTHGELTGSGKNKLTFDQVAIDRATAYSAEDADVILRLWRVLKPRLVAEGMTAVYETLERPLVTVLARMERRGISIDRQVLSRLSGDFAQTAARVEAEIQEIAGEPINVGSPKQLGDIIFGKMNLPGGSKTKTGTWSTSAQVLDELAEQGHEFPKKILEWRQVSKLKSTYTDALPTYVHPQTHRVHTTYALAATTTGRLSSNEPNLQNIPVRTEDGRKIRRAFIASPGHELVSAHAPRT